MAIPKFDDVLDDEGKLNAGAIKHILNNTISTIEENKSQVFDICETARSEVEHNQQLLAELKSEALQVIDEVDALTKEEQQEKQKLVQVSSNFANYSEESIRASYESVKNVQIALAVARDKEKRLREQRDKMEIRLRNLGVMLGQAEHLAMAIGSVLSFLSSQINSVVWSIEDKQKDKFIGASIIKAQEDERYRVSRELHDGPAQDMAQLIYQASICERLIDFDPEEAKQTLQELRHQIRNCLTSIRQVIFDMRPMALDDLGLVPALQQLFTKMHDRGIVTAELAVDGEERDVPKHVEVVVFRVIQEALNNVNRHAGVKTAQVRLLYSRGALSILVEDEGKGFDPDKLPRDMPGATGTADDGGLPLPPESHFGLLGMEERAKLIGAELSVVSAVGKGTRVHMRVPLKG